VLVLIADDEPETCLMVAAILRKAGYTTIVAQDAMQTVALAVQRTPDVIVLDVMMPAGTGIGALEKLKLSNRTSHIPVVVLSGIRDEARIRKVRDLGAAEFLPKPVDEKALLAAVKAALEPSSD
jgi:DNA-binding response OmpR family regulator